MAAKKKATTKTHNDIEDLPKEETPEEFDDENPSNVLGIDIPDPKGKAKASPPADEPDERPGEEVLAAMAEAAAEKEGDEVDDEGAEEGDEAEGDEAEGDEPKEGAAAAEEGDEGDEEGGEEEYKTVRFEREGKITELDVPESVAAAILDYTSAADTTRRKYTELQERHFDEHVQPPPAQSPTTAAATRPAADEAAARITSMMGAIPQVVDAYTPVVHQVRDSLPEDTPLRNFIEDNEVVATIIASLVDGQADARAHQVQAAADRAQTGFRDHVNNLVDQIITSDEANAVLADPDTRNAFDSYLVSLGPMNAEGKHDPTPVRATLMQDNGHWLKERWKDFQLRVALSGAKPDDGEEKPPPRKRTQRSLERRRAIDAGDGSRSAPRARAKKGNYAKDVTEVLSR